MAYRRVEHCRLRSKQSATTTAAARAQSGRLLLQGGWTAAGRQDRSVVLYAKIGKRTCTLYEQKNPFCIQILRAYTGIGDAETQSPGMLRKPGNCRKCAQGQKSLPRATHCTDRDQNLRQRDPNGTVELCPPHPTFRTKVRARRDVPEEEKKMTNYTYTYEF